MAHGQMKSPDSISFHPGYVQIISWNLTRVCNLACAHCYLDAVQRKREAGDELTLAEAEDVIAQIAATAPGTMLVLTGGEPLLRRDLEAIVAAAARRGLMPVIGSNGTLLDAARAEALRAAGAMGVGISLDSVEPGFHDRLRGQTGAWEAAMRGIAAARVAGLAVLIQTTLLAENRQQITALTDLAAGLGATAINFFFLVCTGRGVTQTDLDQTAYEQCLGEIAALSQQREDIMVRARCAPYLRRMLGLKAGQRGGGYAEWSSACLAGRSYFRITPQGQVTPCPYLPQAVGDLRREKLVDIWVGAPALRALRLGLPGGKCGDCDYRVSCGGCRARAFAASGDLMGEDAKCAYVKAGDAEPEQTPSAMAEMTWAEDAERVLERIPGFIRARVQGMIEKKACAEGVTLITAEFMSRHRPPATVMSKFGGRG